MGILILPYVFSQYFWFVMISIPFLSLLRFSDYQKTKDFFSQISPSDSLNTDDLFPNNPIWFLHIGAMSLDARQDDCYSQIFFNLNKSISHFNPNFVLTTGNIVSNRENGSYKRQLESDWLLYDELKNDISNKFNDLELISVCGSNDVFGVSSFDSPNNFAKKVFGNSSTNFRYQNHKISEEVNVIALNPYWFPTPPLSMMQWIFPQASFLKKFYDHFQEIEKKDDDNGISIVLSDHPVNYWYPNYDTDKKNSLLTILTSLKRKVRFILSSQIDDREGYDFIHHGNVVEVIAPSLLKFNTVGLLTIDNGHSFYHPSISLSSDTLSQLEHRKHKSENKAKDNIDKKFEINKNKFNNERINNNEIVFTNKDINKENSLNGAGNKLNNKGRGLRSKKDAAFITFPVPFYQISGLEVFNQKSLVVRAISFSDDLLDLSVSVRKQSANQSSSQKLSLRRVGLLKKPNVWLYDSRPKSNRSTSTNEEVILDFGNYVMTKEGDWEGEYEFVVANSVEGFDEKVYFKENSSAWGFLFALFFIFAFFIAMPIQVSGVSDEFEKWIVGRKEADHISNSRQNFSINDTFPAIGENSSEKSDNYYNQLEIDTNEIESNNLNASFGMSTNMFTTQKTHWVFSIFVGFLAVKVRISKFPLWFRILLLLAVVWPVCMPTLFFMTERKYLSIFWTWGYVCKGVSRFHFKGPKLSLQYLIFCVYPIIFMSSAISTTKARSLVFIFDTIVYLSSFVGIAFSLIEIYKDFGIFPALTSPSFFFIPVILHSIMWVANVKRLLKNRRESRKKNEMMKSFIPKSALDGNENN